MSRGIAFGKLAADCLKDAEEEEPAEEEEEEAPALEGSGPPPEDNDAASKMHLAASFSECSMSESSTWDHQG